MANVKRRLYDPKIPIAELCDQDFLSEELEEMVERYVDMRMDDGMDLVEAMELRWALLRRAQLGPSAVRARLVDTGWIPDFVVDSFVAYARSPEQLEIPLNQSGKHSHQ